MSFLAFCLGAAALVVALRLLARVEKLEGTGGEEAINALKAQMEILRRRVAALEEARLREGERRNLGAAERERWERPEMETSAGAMPPATPAMNAVLAEGEKTRGQEGATLMEEEDANDGRTLPGMGAPLKRAVATPPPNGVELVRTLPLPPSSLPDLPPQVEAQVRPPALPSSPPPLRVTESKRNEGLSLEQFMGVKMLGWLGGLALFFGVAYFVKYSFEHDLIPPVVRVALGYAVAVGALVAGLRLQGNARYVVLCQTLCATGTLVAYGVTYGAHALYHLFGQGLTFGILSVITALALALAVRLEARVVAVLGMLAGFLSPILCSTGEDRPLTLFGYVGLLDIGLLLVARLRGWFFLAVLGAVGTALMEWGWMAKYGLGDDYRHGTMMLVPLAVAVGFVGLFLAGAWRARSWEKTAGILPAVATLVMAATALQMVNSTMLHHIDEGGFWLELGAALLASGAVFVLAVWYPRLSGACVGMAVGVFVLVHGWSMKFLQVAGTPGQTGDELGLALAWRLTKMALGAYGAFGLGFTLAPLALTRKRLAAGRESPWPVEWAAVGMGLLLVPFPVPGAGLIAGGMMALSWWWIEGQRDPALCETPQTKVKAQPAGSPLPLMILLGFVGLVAFIVKSGLSWILFGMDASGLAWEMSGPYALLFAWAGMLVYGALVSTQRDRREPLDERVGAWLALMGWMVFGLLKMGIARLIWREWLLPAYANIGAFEGAGLVWAVLLLAGAWALRMPRLATVATLGLVVMEIFMPIPVLSWSMALMWYAVVYGLMVIYPLVGGKWLREMKLPWATAAVGMLGHFAFVYEDALARFPQLKGAEGVIPAAFALPALAMLWWVARSGATQLETRNAQVAWVGRAALFFVTVIFPIQLRHQWLTVGWALEGAALLWLGRRWPDRGMFLTALGLLAAAFGRLALNPLVLEYARSSAAWPWNWYWWTYGAVAVAFMLAARWAPREREPWLPGVLWGGAGVLVFCLLNLEIASYFAPGGITVEQWGLEWVFGELEGGSRHLGQDMAYSIAWGLYALAVLGLGLWQRARGARFAGLGLLGVTLLKVFFHDLATLESVYRIAALLVVALVALAGSFLYQRYLERTQEG